MMNDLFKLVPYIEMLMMYSFWHITKRDKHRESRCHVMCQIRHAPQWSDVRNKQD